MTKAWILYILSAIGLLVIALWAYRKFTNRGVQEKPPLVSVSTDDPNMIVPDFNEGKPLWDPRWILDATRGLATTYVKVDNGRMVGGKGT